MDAAPDRTRETLALFLETSRSFHELVDVEALLPVIMEKLKSLLGAETSSVILYDPGLERELRRHLPAADRQAGRGVGPPGSRDPGPERARQGLDAHRQAAREGVPGRPPNRVTMSRPMLRSGRRDGVRG
jgi:hypothetical protein